MSRQPLTNKDISRIIKSSINTVTQQKISTSQQINSLNENNQLVERPINSQTLSPNELKREIKNLNTIFSTVRKDK
ncbi:TPA: hypothetical protein ACXNIW_002551 [Proteus mirabilis]